MFLFFLNPIVHLKIKLDCDFICIRLRLQYLRMLAVAYEKTQELARELHAVGCGDLDVEGKN